MNSLNAALIGNLFAIFMSRSNLKVTAYKCNPLLIFSLWGFNCSARGISNVPQDLESSIEILILRNNSFDRLDENSFAKYGKLVCINLDSTNYANTKDPISYQTFWRLGNLERVVMSNVGTFFNLSFHWPEKVNGIWLHGNSFIENIDLSSVRKLKQLDASSCSLRSFPKFYQFAPLEGLDLRLNPLLEHIKVEHVASLCLLKVLKFPYAYNDSRKLCDCLKLRKWMHDYGIEHELDAQVPEKNCFTSISKDIECNLNFSLELQQRTKCLEAQRLPLFSTAFLIIVVVICLIPFIILAFWYSERRQKRLNSEIHNMKTLGMTEMEEYEGDHESDHDYIEISKTK